MPLSSLSRVPPLAPPPHFSTPPPLLPHPPAWLPSPLTPSLLLTSPTRSALRRKPGFPTAGTIPKGTQAIEFSSVIGLVAGSHTYFLAAASHEEVGGLLNWLRNHCGCIGVYGGDDLRSSWDDMAHITKPGGAQL
jgi:hypothetical protein